MCFFSAFAEFFPVLALVDGCEMLVLEWLRGNYSIGSHAAFRRLSLLYLGVGGFNVCSRLAMTRLSISTLTVFDPRQPSWDPAPCLCPRLPSHLFQRAHPLSFRRLTFTLARSGAHFPFSTQPSTVFRPSSAVRSAHSATPTVRCRVCRHPSTTKPRMVACVSLIAGTFVS